MACTLAVAPKVEGEDVQSERVQGFQAARHMTAVSAVSVAEDHVAPCPLVGNDPAGKLQAVRSPEADVLKRQSQARRRSLRDRVQRMKRNDRRHEHSEQGKENEPEACSPCGSGRIAEFRGAEPSRDLLNQCFEQEDG
jgi:hypothetical protein